MILWKILFNDIMDCSKFSIYEKKTKTLSGPTIIKHIEGLQGSKGRIYKFVSYNKFEAKETPLPKEYTKKTQISNEWIKKYRCDNTKQKLEKDNEKYQQIKINHKSHKKYFIHDNGGRPFLVYIDKNNVSIYKKSDKYYIDDESEKDYDNAWMYIALVKSYKAIKVFIGKSPKNKMTLFSGGYGAKFNGNTILIKMSKNKYIYIGEEIYSFETDNNIIKYVSPVGNNDAPYPYAIDNKGNYYLIIENVVIKNVPKKYKNDPYDYYFDYHLITADIGRLPSKQPMINHFNDIVKYSIDKDEYTLTYHPFPLVDYKRLIPSYGNKMYVIKTDGKKYELTKNMYVKIMKYFGKELGFLPLKHKIIQNRLI